jgi:Tol biopolymer transport system component
MDSNGKNKKILLHWDAYVLGISDDSQQFIFSGSPDTNSPSGIYIMNIDGTNLRHLTYFDKYFEEWYSDIE